MKNKPPIPREAFRKTVVSKKEANADAVKKPDPEVRRNSSAAITSLKQLYLVTKEKVLAVEICRHYVQREWIATVHNESKHCIEENEEIWDEEIESMSRNVSLTPQKRHYKKVIRASQSASTLSSSMATIATASDILRAKKMMDCSVSTELKSCRLKMSRAKLHKEKQVNILRVLAKEIVDMIEKLFNNYMKTVNSAFRRSREAYDHYMASLNRFDGSPVKEEARKRFQQVVNQQTTLMCASLQTIEDINDSILEIQSLLKKGPNKNIYNFDENNCIRILPDHFRKFFSNSFVSSSRLQSPSRVRLLQKRRSCKVLPASKCCEAEKCEQDVIVMDLSGIDVSSVPFTYSPARIVHSLYIVDRSVETVPNTKQAFHIDDNVTQNLTVLTKENNVALSCYSSSHLINENLVIPMSSAKLEVALSDLYESIREVLNVVSYREVVHCTNVLIRKEACCEKKCEAVHLSNKLFTEIIEEAGNTFEDALFGGLSDMGRSGRFY